MTYSKEFFKNYSQLLGPLLLDFWLEASPDDKGNASFIIKFNKNNNILI